MPHECHTDALQRQRRRRMVIPVVGHRGAVRERPSQREICYARVIFSRPVALLVDFPCSCDVSAR